ncbi:ECF transporter S component [Spiroplasma endosymbiont of Labia minor]|uniref:ECF transporter S component n=1 Tax=Spiroplasma endosymbiont of Labia minor TaxID=3066305 RepID=UPI0030CF10D3
MQQISEWLLTSNHMAIMVTGLIGGFAFIYIIYNAISYAILRERYHGIRFTTKNIAYITMFTAVSVSVTVVVSMTVPITVFPPIRIAIEGVMVKITGFMFGPIVGLLVGLITEGLTMLFVPSFIHPAFIICICAFGFISGIGSSFNRISGSKRNILLILINLFVTLFGIFIYVIYAYWRPVNNQVSILGIVMSKEIYMWFFIATLILTLLIVWITYFSLIKNHAKMLDELLPVMLIAITCEYLATTLISAWGDGEFLGIPSTEGYSTMVAIRLVQAPLKIIFNSFVLYFSYKAVKPLIKKDR